MKLKACSGLVMAVMLSCAACVTSNDEDPSANTSEAPRSSLTTTSRSTATAATAQTQKHPTTWREFSDWESPTKLLVNGVEAGELVSRHECFNDECTSPMDYWLTQDLVVPVGAVVEIRANEDTELLPKTRQLSPDLAFGPLEGPPINTGSTSVTFDKPGLYHLDVRADIEFPDFEGLHRVRHYLWVQVVGPPASCVDEAALTAIPISGATDSLGCPSQSVSLSIESLHPHFHCSPWPISVELASRPGERYLRTQFGDRVVDVVAIVPEDSRSTGAFIPGGELFESPTDGGAVYVARDDGSVERWGIDEQQVGCD